MVTGEILLKEVLDFTVQPSVIKWKTSVNTILHLNTSLEGTETNHI